MEFVTKLVSAADGMSQAERACLKVLLAAATAGMMPSGRIPRDPTTSAALAAAVLAISRLQPHRRRVPPNGVVYRGRPSWVTGELLRCLQDESSSLRSAAVRFHDHLVASGAPHAREVALSAEFATLLHAHSGPVEPTTKANYLYYDEPGLGIEPHLDTEEFSLNAIMLLEHTDVPDPSALVLFPTGTAPERVHLAPGEIIVFFADSVVHARERMKPGETVRIAAFGFTAIEAFDDR